MKALLLSHTSDLHVLLQHELRRRRPDAEIARTHTLASALPYLRQEPEIDHVVLDLGLCGWSRMSTLVTTLRPCLGSRQLVLLVETVEDVMRVRAQGVTVDACLPKSAGLGALADLLLQIDTTQSVLTAARWSFRDRQADERATPGVAAAAVSRGAVRVQGDGATSAKVYSVNFNRLAW
ncbi:hypothetical protein ACWA7J_06775 [Leptothrix sp. BB-4]